MAKSAVEIKEEIDWARTAQLCALLANINRDPKRTQAMSAKDFNPVLQAKQRQKQEKIKVPITVLKRLL